MKAFFRFRPFSARLRAARRAGFSLVEVAFALVIAAGGLISVFAVFPVSLRQSQLSRSDMVEGAFASTLLQTLGGNIRMIDDLSVWNDPKKFWAAAVAGTGLPSSISDENNGSAAVYALHQRALDGQFTGRAGSDGKAGRNLSPMTTSVAHAWNNDGREENVWFVATERETVPAAGAVPAKEIIQPSQYLVRLACVRRPARRATGNRSVNNWALPTRLVYADPVGKWEGCTQQERAAFLPNIYILSVVSTDRAFPDVFIHEPVFSQEFTFVHRP